ncbi:MAG: signal peptidase I [Bacilli bacterium]|nr:signal peptidase I [Bacilli bacterium]
MKNLKIKMNKKVLLGLRIGLYVLISVVLGLTVYSWNAKNLTGNALPMPFGVGSAIVLSGSMEPELSVNDLIFIKEVDEYLVNDVVVFQENSSLVVHRIIEINGDQVITQGDANNVADEAIAMSDIKGKVVMHIPFVGSIVSAIKSPIGIVCILGVAVVLLVLSYRKEKDEEIEKINKIKEEIRKLKEENK